jgi:hypothetical protein
VRALAKWLVILVGLGLAAAACGSPTAAPRASKPARSSSPGVAPIAHEVHWWIAAGALRRLEAVAGSGFVDQVFTPATSTLIVAPAQAGEYPSWAGHLALDATSLGGVRAALRVARPGDVVLLDIEHWPRTPLAEQLAAAATYQEAGVLARAAGVELVAAPATDLALVLEPGQKVTTGFLASGVVQAAAKAASIFEIQAQGLEANPARYAAYVDVVERLARTANPAVRFVLGLSTNPSGQHVSPTALAADIARTRVDALGYWLNIPQAGISCPRCGVAQPQVAVSLLRGTA